MEDIDKLISESQTQDTLMFIDSKLRDRMTYSNPQEYCIRFSKPLRNVFSIKVIDSSIPRTHYTVSSVSNSFVYRIGSEGPWTTLHVPVGNYTIDELIVVMNSMLTNLTVSHLSYPSDLRKQLLFKSAYQFEIDTKLSSMKYILGLDCSASVERRDTPEAFILESKDEQSLYDYATTTDRLDFDSTAYIAVTSDTVVYFPLHKDFQSYLHAIRLNISAVSERCDCVVAVVQLTGVGKNVLTQTKQSIDPSTSTIEVVFNDTANSLQLDDMFVGVSFSNFEVASANFNAQLPTTWAVTDDHVYTVDLQMNVMLNLNNIQSQSLSSALNIQEIRAFKKHSMVAPGMYNLVGDTYVSLRCKEVDQHVGALQTANFTDGTGEVISKDFDYGLAVFKLGIVGYQDERFDYNTSIERNFFPIGKLSQLTFRFERWDGSLYDFKGVNHTFTLQIKFYAPKPNHTERAAMSSSLNPSYNPEFIDY